MILIDVRYLPPPPADPATVDHPALAWVLACLRQSADHHLWLAPARPDQAPALRRAWAAHLPAHRLHLAPSVQIPTDPAHRRLGAILDRAAVRALAPALYWLPAADDLPPLEPPPLDLPCATLATLSGHLDPALLPWTTATGATARYWHWVQLAQRIGHPDTPEAAARLQDSLLVPPQALWPIPAADPQAQAQALARFTQLAPPAPRPTLAFVSPLPPVPSGISDYSAELLPPLARHFDITLVNAGPPLTDPVLEALFPVVDLAAFQARAGDFDHIVYQMGNAEYHAHMVDLIRTWPGVVVLHDFFLGHMHAWRQFQGGIPQALTQALYDSHGLPGLRTLAEDGVEAAILGYPCNRDLLSAATGVIVHSDHAQALGRQWLPGDLADQFHIIPHLRRPVVPAPDRAAARTALGLAEDDFLVCSFGFLGPSKCNEQLLQAWLDSPLAARPDCHLVFVGKNPDSDYGHAIARRLHEPAGQPIRITGYADRDSYRTWLAAADVAVQLRRHSRGESSGTALDALAHGVPLIINAHGTMADLPAEPLCRLPDPVTVPALQQALEQLHADPARRQRMSAAGRAHIQHHHHPLTVADQYRQALTTCQRHSPVSHYLHLAATLGRACPDVTPLDSLAHLLAQQVPGPRRCYVDITALRQAPHVTGIERVTQALLLALLEQDNGAGTLVPVYEDPAAGGYREARDWLLTQQGLSPLQGDPLILPRPRDQFLGLDWAPAAIVRRRDQLQAWRQRGVRLGFLVHDILPVTDPQWFPPHVPLLFRAWLDTLAALADDCFCVSGATADALADHWRASGLDPMPRIQVSHNGADFLADPGLPPPPLSAPVAQAVREGCLLMVGTIEPRKGHAQALDALERLWAEDLPLHLVVVGREGWRQDSPQDRAPVARLAARLRQHPQQGQRLHWLEDACDGQLLALYRGAWALLGASEGEGFGLPLVEAAHQGLPLILRDIPVFREIAGDGAWYFAGAAAEDPTGQGLARCIRDWLDARAAGQLPPAGGMAPPTWQESARRLWALFGEVGDNSSSRH
ncbi:Glycosyltransferase involved in cell wall bisynthesis [Ectothiorhodospira magna]|uniref:Glycosyltransferase involved in cell wall bisynthesis n=1 Tax=Ectothiorhodospira magna TaxID=867345 RepID=A0A1H9BLU8_9GAMM|nr:glycosyltransferase [Ectothiorhodospira magna]SEP89513.1 Glycosyltransferase involved in cell wall bisynthesis [Ectothiorhodospira magna]